MSDQARVSAGLQGRIREFTAFYEAHAYLAYNLAFRITCEPAAASRAVQRGFLRQLDARPPGLVAGVTIAALEEAPAAADGRAAGDSESQMLMAAMSALAPAERAALALAELAEAGHDVIGEAVGVPRDQAEKLLERGRESFAAELERPPDEAEAAARGWMWAPPPQEIWEELYPQFHREVERELRRGSAEQTLVLSPGSAHAGKQTRAAKRLLRARRPARVGRLQRLSPRVLLAAAILVLGLGAVGITRMQASDASPNESPYASEADDSYSADPTPSQAAKQADAAKPRKPLTAALLDKLRLRELRQLRDYTKRQADTRLPARQRRAAARRISAIERAARARLRAQQRREAVIRDREARQRARDQAPPAPASSPADRPPAPSQPRPRPQTTTPSTPPANRDDAERSCLLDENTGQYICPH